MGENNEEIVKWEEFMPRTVLRVLLVEPDDSTRQILTALLRKCNYKVAAIADGLQAWEILKKRHNCIDLILTELDLPSISGYPLLTLITEHDSCKNIPVIVTSSQDSISVVVKCMLKGAADFLIKPVRKNELKNLWRHVWRKLTIDGQYPQNLGIQQHEAKAAFVNNPTTDPSANTVSTSQKSSKCSEKATDTQSSCTTSYLINDKETEQILKNVKMEKVSIPSKESGHSREAMNLIGNMNKRMCIVAQASSNGEFQSLNSTPELQLSLKRPHDLESKEEVESHSLNHSNASNYSWYNSDKMSQGSGALVFNGGIWTEYDPMIQPMFDSPMGHGPGPAAKSLSLSDPGTRNFITDNSSGQAESGFSNRGSVDPHGYSSSQVIGLSDNGESDLTDVNTSGPGPSMARTSAVEKVVKDENCNTFELDQIGHRTSHQAYQSAEREAALARFRLKRKERCYDKKVLYQNRKRIADQRPRVKGQFVRQVQLN
ncbi:hypothetical protein KSS87_020277 [Heliosperma pusillum]|nr:hypothetical protein KSS87_020277 [Heliosperma pusillum]